MSTIDLYAAAIEPNARVTVAENLSPGEHTLRLSVSDGANALSQGLRCTIDALYVHGADEAAWPWITLVSLIAALALDTVLIVRIWPRVRWLLTPGS